MGEHNADKDELNGPEFDRPGWYTPPAERDAPICKCFWTDPSAWLSASSCGHGSGYEPGSQMEWNPDCLMHPPAQVTDGDDGCRHIQPGQSD